jgi:hypothetical protein
MKTAIPHFTPAGILPPGIHWASWSDIEARFGYTVHRRELLLGLLAGLGPLKAAGCRAIFLDGSFCTDKQVPGDFDVCYDDDLLDWELLQRIAPVLLDFSNLRAAQKATYMGEFFPYSERAAPPNILFLEFFQTDKISGQSKGIVGLKL